MLQDQEALDRVKVAYPDMVITDEGLAASAYHTKIKTLAAGNELPDLFIIRGSLLETLIDNNLVQSVESDIGAAGDRCWPDDQDYTRQWGGGMVISSAIRGEGESLNDFFFPLFMLPASPVARKP